MSFPTKPFYVYADNPDPMWHNPVIVTFPSRSAADEYWRHVLETEAKKPADKRIRRRRWHSQHFVTPSPALYPVDDSRPNWLHLEACLVQSVTTLVVLPTQDDHRPDNKNGAAFYIRSAVRPNWFWYYHPTRKRVVISSTNQTKFIIRRRNPLPFDCYPDEDILIWKDDINIFVSPYLISAEATSDVGEMIVKGPSNRLIAASIMPNPQTSDTSNDADALDVARNKAGTFKFEMFDGGFGIGDGPITWENGWVCASSRVGGGDLERWEFVQ